MNKNKNKEKILLGSLFMTTEAIHCRDGYVESGTIAEVIEFNKNEHDGEKDTPFLIHFRKLSEATNPYINPLDGGTDWYSKDEVENSMIKLQTKQMRL